MHKQDIIEKIIRTTKENNGIPLGRMKFETETGIKVNDWIGKYWARWGDAVKEAGFMPNKMTAAYEESYLIEQLILLIKEIKKFPVDSEIGLKAYKTANFPANKTFKRLGTTIKRANKILDYCEGKSDLQDVAEICRNYISSVSKKDTIQSENAEREIGFVYLLKHGFRREYKIGKTFNPIRREGEIALQLPEKLEPIHYIETDDPSGIENYWHNRFKDKKKQGEWFDLSAGDVKAFKKWKRIV